MVHSPLCRTGKRPPASFPIPFRRPPGKGEPGIAAWILGQTSAGQEIAGAWEEASPSMVAEFSGKPPWQANRKRVSVSTEGALSHQLPLTNSSDPVRLFRYV